MILADTSAWVEYLRATGSPAHLRLRALVEAEAPVVITDVVVLELLAGARGEERALLLRRLLWRFDHEPADLADHEEAARLYRTCRRGGSTIRAVNDCLVAAVARRIGAAVLHADRDFDAIARHVDLEVDGG